MNCIEARAADLVNSSSGIANDFLNHFNEVLLLIENMPVLLPEMLDDLMGWKPRTYVGYFEASNLPGRFRALEIYRSLDPEFVAFFEGRVDALNILAEEYVEALLKHRRPDGSINPDDIDEYCATVGGKFRSALGELQDLVNYGYGGEPLNSQTVADAYMKAAG